MKKLSVQQILAQYTDGQRDFQQKVIIVDQSLQEKNLSGANFNGARFRGADFSGAKLQGASFRKAELQGAKFTKAKLQAADFSGAKLQGANFTGANLREANFTKAEADLQRRWKIIGGIGLFFLSFIFGRLIVVILDSYYYLGYTYLWNFLGGGYPERLLFFSVLFLYLGFIIVNLGLGIEAALFVLGMETIAVLLSATSQPFLIGTAWVLNVAVFMFMVVSLAMIIRSKTWIVVWSILLILVSTFIFFFYSRINLTDTIVFIEDEIPFSVFFAFFIYLSIITALGIMAIVTKAVIIGIPRVLAVFTSATIPFIVYIRYVYNIGFFTADPHKIRFLSLFLFSAIVLGVYIGWSASKGDRRYVLVLNWALSLGARGNTSFRAADLTKARFYEARLQHSDLRGTIPYHTDWYGAKGLEHARVGKTYLQSLQVRKLVAKKSEEVKNKNFDGLDLSGIKLQPGTRLVDASFVGTNLSKAHLKEVDLSNAQLVKTNLDGADLEGATLTGIFMQNWHITKETNIDKVICDYLHRGQPTEGNHHPLREPENEREKMDFKEFCQEFIEAEEKLKPFYRTLEQLYLISDKVILEYRLIEEARKADISEASYRKIFENYCRQKKHHEWHQPGWRSIFAKLEVQIANFSELISDMHIFPILERVSQLSIVIAVVLFVNEIAQQKLESKYRAWEILNESGDKGGTIVALKNWKKYGGSLQGIQAGKANLENINLSDADLTNANFSFANLKHINLSYTDLTNANFRKADLQGANLSFANSKEATLDDVAKLERIRSTFNKDEDADFFGAILKDAKLRSADLRYANFSSADLSRANLFLANLSYAKLDQAKLSNASLPKSKLKNAKLEDAILMGAFLIGADLRNADLRNADLQDAYLQDAYLAGADFRGANLRGANLSGAYLVNTKNLTPSQIKSAYLWEEAIYKANYNDEQEKWIIDEEANQKYIEELNPNADRP